MDSRPPTDAPGAGAVQPAPTTTPTINYVEEGTVPPRLARWRQCTIVDEVEPPAGCLRWATPLPAGRVEHPVLAGDAVYVTGNGAVHAVSAATGAHRWTARLGAQPAGPVAVDRATVVVGLRTGEVAAYGADSGLELWRAAVGDADVLVDAEALAVAAIGRDGMLTLLDRVTGVTRWRVDTGIPRPTGIAIGNGHVRVSEPTTGLGVEFDLTTGDRTRPETIGGDPVPGGPAPAVTYWLEDRLPRPTSTATVGGTVLAATDDGDLVAYDAAARQRLWHVEIPGSPAAPLAIVARPGTVFVARGNAVIALALPARPDEPGTPADVWQQLRRPFQLPTRAPGECPVSPTADGPFGRAALGEHTSVAHLDDGGTILFVPREGYTGPLLVRGLLIDGQRSLSFRQRPAVAVDELQLDERNARYADVRHWGAVLDPPGPGCWVLQLDGLDFRDRIVFRIGPS